MNSVRISFTETGRGLAPAVDLESAGLRLVLPACLQLSVLDRGAVAGASEMSYGAADRTSPHAWRATRDCSVAGVDISIEDTWTPTTSGVQVRRRIRASGGGGGAGVNVALRASVAGVPDHRAQPAPLSAFRFCAPAMVYSASQHAERGTWTFSDGRLSYPAVTAWDPTTRWSATLRRVTLATFDAPPQRAPGQSAFLQRSDLGAVGFSTAGELPELLAHWPFAERDHSAMLDAQGTPAVAYAPTADGLDATVTYELAVTPADTFADAVFTAFSTAYAWVEPTPAALPFTLAESIQLRASSLARTYTEWGEGGAGFLLNFDPDRGYDAPAKAFGASFTDHAMGSSRGVLEYGFTGRQLNAGATLADLFGGEWLERSRKVADFFVSSLATPTGWVYPLYSIDLGRPVYSCGDPSGPVMHYLGTSPVSGAYTRMMAEAVSDLLLCHRLHAGHGEAHPPWLVACRAFGDFLVRVQEPDGSWFRAYTPDGTPLRSGPWFGGSPREGKASTAAPVALLVDLAHELGKEDGAPYLAAAERAGAYVLAEQVAVDDYRGGTLDNPNVVDKEASLLAMRALLALHTGTGAPEWLRGADRAARIAVTWHWIWDVPLLPETRVGRAGVRSTGWGGINSTWGAGVTDIYTLFFLDDLVTLARRTGVRLYADVAALAAAGCQQILSYPGEDFGFADAGMQPEGIAFCDQGVDEGLIAKGDTWGGLGWIYTAGTDGMRRYLRSLDDS